MMVWDVISWIVPWQKLIDSIKYNHGIVIASCIDLHRWFFMYNFVLFLPIFFFVVIPQIALPTNPVYMVDTHTWTISSEPIYQSANNFSCTSFQSCFARSWFFLTPYQPTLRHDMHNYANYDMKVAYLVVMAILFLGGIVTSSGM